MGFNKTKLKTNTQKGTTKTPAVDLLRLNILRGTKTTLLTPKRNDEHPRPFYMGVPLPPRDIRSSKRHVTFLKYMRLGDHHDRS